MKKLILITLMLLAVAIPTDLIAGHYRSNQATDDNQINFNNPDIHLRVPHDIDKHKKLDLLLEFDFFSKYVSKGLPSSEGPVWQPSVTLEYYNVGVSVWSNFVLNDEPNQGEFNEVDILPYYNLEIDKFTFIPAVNFIIGVNDNPQSLNHMTHNIIRPQFHISYRVGSLAPYMDTFIYAYPTNRFGMYFDIGLNYNYMFSEFLQLDTSVQLAVGGKRWNSPRIADVGTQLNNFEFILSISYSVSEAVSLAPVIHVVVAIPQSIRKHLNKSDLVWGGLMMKCDL